MRESFGETKVLLRIGRLSAMRAIENNDAPDTAARALVVAKEAIQWLDF
jgi:hypothetical protein